jgi:hypothetical protein
MTLDGQPVLSGTLTLAQLPAGLVTNGASGVTLTGTFLGAATTAGNFTGSLAGDVTGTQGGTVVTTVGGQTAVSVAGGVSAANGATNADVPGAIVRRDATGSFATTNLTLDGNLDLPATTGSAGIIYSGGTTFLHAFGFENIFAGSFAGNLTLMGGENTGVGCGALGNLTTGSANTATGSGALIAETVGSGNTASGCAALSGNNGDNNTAVGDQALYHNISGSNNIALGYGAGYNPKNGSYNIEIGNPGTASDNNTILIGTQGVQTNTAIAGIFGATAASGVPVYVTATGQLGTLTSSARFKQNIRSMADASDVLLALRPVTFQYKPGIDPHGTQQFGLVAEEVEQVDPDLVARDDKNQIYTVRYEAVNAMLLNEFQKEHRTVAEQSAEIKHLEQSVTELKRLVRTLAGTAVAAGGAGQP